MADDGRLAHVAVAQSGRTGAEHRCGARMGDKMRGNRLWGGVVRSSLPAFR